MPRAALALAQGFGRLIRHRGDRGIVALLDKRAVTKPYGRRVLAGLPPDCPRTASLDDVRTFWTRQTMLPLVGRWVPSLRCSTSCRRRRIRW